MKPADRKRLALLTQIAEIKATRAKSLAAKELRAVQDLEARVTNLHRQRHEILPAMNTPETALVVTRWLAACELRVKDLNSQVATARANSEAARDHARFEEGRRHVLTNLNDQAS